MKDTSFTAPLEFLSLPLSKINRFIHFHDGVKTKFIMFMAFENHLHALFYVIRKKYELNFQKVLKRSFILVAHR